MGESVKQGLASLLSTYMSQHCATAISITIGEVQMSPDLRHARVFCLPLQRNLTPSDIVEELNQKQGALRTQLAKSMALRFAPQLRFVVDTRWEQAAALDQAFAQHDS